MARSPNAGRPKHNPTPDLRRQVETMAGLGIGQREICVIVGVGSHNTLSKYYRPELDSGMAKATSRVAQRFYEHALSGRDWKATREWLRLFGGEQWKEAPRVEVTGKDGGPIELSAVDRIVQAAVEREALDGGSDEA